MITAVENTLASVQSLDHEQGRQETVALRWQLIKADNRDSPALAELAVSTAHTPVAVCVVCVGEARDGLLR